MNEAQYWREIVRPAFMSVPNADVCRIENTTQSGTPDVNGCVWGTDFWMELKSLPKLPKLTNTIIRIPHYTQSQRLWIRRRGLAGGRVYLLLHLMPSPRKHLHMVFNWESAVRYVGRCTLQELHRFAVIIGEDDFPIKALGFLVRMIPPTADLVPLQLPVAMTPKPHKRLKRQRI
jgi:hypothetical protein